VGVGWGWGWGQTGRQAAGGVGGGVGVGGQTGRQAAGWGWWEGGGGGGRLGAQKLLHLILSPLLGAIHAGSMAVVSRCWACAALVPVLRWCLCCAGACAALVPVLRWCLCCAGACAAALCAHLKQSALLAPGAQGQPGHAP
jgi:hypothetical protein